MKTIEPDTQELILDVLPKDGLLALELMCQLLANMIISIDGASVTCAIDLIKFHVDEYEGT